MLFVTLTGVNISVQVYQSADHVQETVSSVKAAICTSFSLDPSSVVLWDFFNSTKHACLDAQLDSTLAAVRVIDKQALLVEVKVGH